MNKKELSAFVTSSVLYIFGVGLQVSGYQDLWVAKVCFILATLLFVFLIALQLLDPVKRTTLWPFGMISLHEASSIAYTKLRGTLWAQAAERLNIHQTPEGIQEYIAQGIAGEIPLFGKYLPATKLEPIKEFEINMGTLTEGGRTLRLRDQARTVITDISVRRRDLRRAISLMKETKA